MVSHAIERTRGKTGDYRRWLAPRTPVRTGGERLENCRRIAFRQLAAIAGIRVPPADLPLEAGTRPRDHDQYVLSSNHAHRSRLRTSPPARSRQESDAPSAQLRLQPWPAPHQRRPARPRRLPARSCTPSSPCRRSPHPCPNLIGRLHGRGCPIGQVLPHLGRRVLTLLGRGGRAPPGVRWQCGAWFAATGRIETSESPTAPHTSASHAGGLRLAAASAARTPRAGRTWLPGRSPAGGAAAPGIEGGAGAHQRRAHGDGRAAGPTTRPCSEPGILVDDRAVVCASRVTVSTRPGPGIRQLAADFGRGALAVA